MKVNNEVIKSLSIFSYTIYGSGVLLGWACGYQNKEPESFLYSFINVNLFYTLF